MYYTITKKKKKHEKHDIMWYKVLGINNSPDYIMRRFRRLGTSYANWDMKSYWLRRKKFLWEISISKISRYRSCHHLISMRIMHRARSLLTLLTFRFSFSNCKKSIIPMRKSLVKLCARLMHDASYFPFPFDSHAARWTARKVISYRYARWICDTDLLQCRWFCTIFLFRRKISLLIPPLAVFKYPQPYIRVISDREMNHSKDWRISVWAFLLNGNLR